MPDLSDRDQKLKPKFKHPLYPVWKRIQYRCYAKSCPRYAEWGGRGIRVAQEWLDDFWAFVEHIGPRPSIKHSIDRIDNDGHYEPGNVRWATPREQTLNSSQVVMWTFDGKTQCIKDWARELEVPYKLLTKRKKLGWAIKDILTIVSSPYSRKSGLKVLKGCSKL